MQKKTLYHELLYPTSPRLPEFQNSYLDSNLEVFLEEILN